MAGFITAAISLTPTLHLTQFMASFFSKPTLLLSFSTCIFHVWLPLAPHFKLQCFSQMVSIIPPQYMPLPSHSIHLFHLNRWNVEMCDLVLCLREDFDGKLGFNQLFNDCCLAIYWSLKLHLKFHCTDVSGHERLRELHLFFKPRKLTIFLLKNMSRILEVRS